MLIIVDGMSILYYYIIKGRGLSIQNDDIICDIVDILFLKVNFWR